MIHKKYLVTVFSIITMFSIIFLLQSAKPVAADPSSHLCGITTTASCYYWEMNFDFNGSYDGELRIEYTDSYGYTTQFIAPVPCFQEHGAVPLTSSDVYFPGNAYLRCEVPNIQDIVGYISGWQYIVPEIENYDEFTISATGILDDDAPYVNPVLTHFGMFSPDMRLAIERSNNAAWLTTEFDGSGHSSGGWDWLTLPYSFDLLIERTMGIGGINYQMNGQTSVVPANLVEFYTQQTEIYIGHDPDTGEYIKGYMFKLRLDPGNFIVR